MDYGPFGIASCLFIKRNGSGIKCYVKRFHLAAANKKVFSKYQNFRLIKVRPLPAIETRLPHVANARNELLVYLLREKENYTYYTTSGTLQLVLVKLITAL